MPHTILLADDSITIRKVVELTFSDTEVRVETAATGHDALARFRASRPDLVLADTSLPGIDGYEVCRAVKGSDRPVPVVLLCGAFERFDEERAAASGADAHLVKPFDSNGLFSQVTALIARSSSAEARSAAAPAAVAPPDAPPAPVVAQVAPEASASEESPYEAEEAADWPSPPASPVRRPAAALSEAELDALARRVVERLTEDVVREIAWEVVPELAEALVRERIRQIESGEGERN